MNMNDIAQLFLYQSTAQKDFNRARYYFGFVFSGSENITTIYSESYNPNLFMRVTSNRYTINDCGDYVLVQDVLAQIMGGATAKTKKSITQEFVEGFRITQEFIGSGMYVEFRGDDLYFVDGEIIADGLYVFNNNVKTPMSERQKTHLTTLMNKYATPEVGDDT